MGRDLILIKLGGSLITDKRGDAAARTGVIERLADEIAGVRGRLAEGLVLGHGSGSFGHVAAARHGLGHSRPPGAASAPPIGVAETQDMAARLHRIVLGALVGAGVPAWTVAPSSAFLATDGRLTGGFVEPVVRALGQGLLPVTYGDVVADTTRGASICSTEMALDFLTGELESRGYRVRRLLWLGETGGIYDRAGETVPRVDAGNVDEVRRLIDDPAGTDVTGGMLLRLETARSLARRGIASWIFDGRRPGSLAAALLGEDVPGTRVVPDDT